MNSNKFVEVSDKNILCCSPLVSVLMITYNHEEYLKDAIEGVVNQVCEFEFELIIGEDASKDNTLSIAHEYQKKYPELIRVIYSEKNVGMNQNSTRIFQQARGKYVAYCEGDDFWCDQRKLSKQVKLIESNPLVSIVHTDWTRATKRNNEWIYSYQKSVHRRVDNKYLEGDLSETWHYPKILRTCTILLRKTILEEWYSCGIMKNEYHFGDSVLSAWITKQGLVGYIPSVTAVYRVSPNSALRSGVKARVAFYRSAIEFDEDAQTFFAARGIELSRGYRWEAGVSLIIWGLKARDTQAIKDGILDLKQEFGFIRFVKTGLQSIVMRLPSVKHQARIFPDSKP